MFTSFFGIIIGILILSLMMLVHELGHFIAGKSLGFRILSFNIFMGPVLWQHRGKDGVLYCIRLFPIGASVEFAGEESGINDNTADAGDAEQRFQPDDPGLFFNRPRWARAIVIAMGPFINFLTAFLALAILFSALGVIVPRVEDIAPSSPAFEAGFQPGDRVLQMNGHKISTVLDYSFIQNFDATGNRRFLIRHSDGTMEELSLPRAYETRYRLGIYYTRRGDGRIIVDSLDGNSPTDNTMLQAGDEILSINGIPIQDQRAFAADKERDHIQVELKRNGEKMTVPMKAETFQAVVDDGLRFVYSPTFPDALAQAALYPVSIVRATVQGLGMMFSGAIAPKDGLAGPVGIVSMIGGVVKEEISLAEKIHELVMLFAFISVAVGFTNLLPIPPFDGFQLLILLIEGIRRKDLSMKLKNAMAMFGLIIIILLAILVFWLDISRLLGV